jgi:ABC-type bacteriocin/lantibiotic exporter with double-glycine peptidase domain
MAGMIDTADGAVTLDGVDVKDWPQDLLRRHLVYVPQDPAIFSASIDQNIAMWDNAIAQADIGDALARAGLAALMRTRAGGSHAALAGHAPALSGGEMQRVALARALARKPRVLVLDETTSALDVDSESKVMAQLRACGATVVLVTHRVSAAMQCDEAIVLDQGQVAARGIPRELFRPSASAAPAPSAASASEARSAA